jgi:hypothetical protein
MQQHTRQAAREQEKKNFIEDDEEDNKKQDEDNDDNNSTLSPFSFWKPPRTVREQRSAQASQQHCEECHRFSEWWLW